VDVEKIYLKGSYDLENLCESDDGGWGLLADKEDSALHSEENTTKSVELVSEWMYESKYEHSGLPMVGGEWKWLDELTGGDGHPPPHSPNENECGMMMFEKSHLIAEFVEKNNTFGVKNLLRKERQSDDRDSNHTQTPINNSDKNHTPITDSDLIYTPIMDSDLIHTPITDSDEFQTTLMSTPLSPPSHHQQPVITFNVAEPPQSPMSETRSSNRNERLTKRRKERTISDAASSNREIKSPTRKIRSTYYQPILSAPTSKRERQSKRRVEEEI
jgi:hypothetical protein